MILPRYHEAFRTLSDAQLHCALKGLTTTRPEILELGDFESGSELLDFCLAERVSQAEVIMGMRNDPSVAAVSAVEHLMLHAIDRRSPREVELERDAARPRPAPVPPVEPRNRDDRVIVLLVEGNPKRGASAERFAKYRTGMTVAEFCAAGGTGSDVKWDLNKQFIKLLPPGSDVTEEKTGVAS